MNLKYYNHFQLADVVHEKNEEMNLQKLKGLKLRDKYQIATSRLSDHEIFLSTVAMDDMSSVGRLVAVCLKQKRAISEITNRMSLSIRGMYHVKSFTENNMDIQRLVLSFGGPKLCYALAKALNLPSVRTVQSKSNFPAIRPCVGFPLRKEIEANLDSVHDTEVFWEKGKPLPCRGFSLLIDEIALEQRPKYDTDRDCVVGFSRFDAASCDMYHPTEETLGAMVDAIREGTLTRATEATLAAIAPLHPDLYTPVPLLISGTCKRETDRLQTKWILEIIKTWTESPNGAAFYGPLWSIASDAPFILYSRRSLMNMRCGENDLTADFDWKHKFKNFASLLRSASGFLVADFHVSAIQLKARLRTLPNLDSVRLDALFNNKDHMNVKNAVSLHSGLYELSRTIDLQQCDPGDIPIALLSRLCGYLVRPFKTPNMTLSEQLESLSAAAHLFFILFRANRTSFCPGQLYYDVQTMIKNIFWTVAKQKILDPSGVHHIGLNGGDRLEGLYGIYRLMDNSRNVDILQLSQRASTTAESCRIFAKHPDWDRGHKRLRLEGAEGVDHTNPRSHTGDVSVANVSLLTSWNCGRRQAIELMKLLKIPVEDITLLLRSDTVDLLRPHGSYVGLREGDIDFTMSWMDDISDVVDPQPSEAAQDTLDRDENGLEELEELLPAPGNNDLDSVRKKDRAWLTLRDAGGKPKHCHKASAVRYLLCTEDGLKSTDRLARVQGLAKIRCYSRNPATPSLADDSVVGDIFLLNQLVATFIRVKNDVALAVLRVTAIENEKKTLLSSIVKSELSSDKVTLRGQVLVLSFDVNRDPKLKTPATQKSHWVWQPNQFESFNVADGQVTKKSSIIEVPATLTQCVKGTLVPHPAGRCTWQFDVDTLLALSDFLWQDMKANVKSLPSRKATATFPCRDDKGEYLFINSEGSAAIQSGPKDGHDACHLCLAEVELKKMRDYVARHLAANRIGVKENLKHPLTDNPCGFCGRSGTCNLDLAKTTRSYIPESNCPYFRKFSLASAEKTTTSGPSTNRPLRCEICHGSQPERTQIRRHEHVFWSYNLPAHIESSHPDTDISADFAASFAVTDEELINLKLKTKAAKQGGKHKAADGGEAPASQRRRTV
ncbi:hypothetical protein B0H13DRAFT_2361998 [Mycena leptocephala]|nr:hypothetical protein B0H13DRAFT_2361998 [Mycena leptocephala]